MAASKFDYVGMVAVQTDLDTKGKAISAFVDSIAEKATNGVNACYSGAAADAYVAAFKKVASDVTTAINDIVTKLSQGLEQENADYTANEQRMTNSVPVVNLND